MSHHACTCQVSVHVILFFRNQRRRRVVTRKSVNLAAKQGNYVDSSTTSTAITNFTLAQMHHCLSVPEILSNIFQYVKCAIKEGPATLASAARTCKTFSEPALDILWRDQSSLMPLIKCLPANALKESRFSKSRLVNHTHLSTSSCADCLFLGNHQRTWARGLYPDSLLFVADCNFGSCA